MLSTNGSTSSGRPISNSHEEDIAPLELQAGLEVLGFFSWMFSFRAGSNTTAALMDKPRESRPEAERSTAGSESNDSFFKSFFMNVVFGMLNILKMPTRASELVFCLKDAGPQDASLQVPLSIELDPSVPEPGLQVLLCHIFQEIDLVHNIGHFAGLWSSFCFGKTGRECGQSMRHTLPSIYAAAVPHVYVFGGSSVFTGVLQTTSRFNIAHNTWDAVCPMSTPRRLCCAAVCGGKLYVFGGECEDLEFWYTAGMNTSADRYRQLSSAECFNPFKGTWQCLPPMPTARAGCAAAVIGGLIYILGGRINKTVQNVAERYDTGVCRWERVPDMPLARSGCAAAALMGAAYVIGGKESRGQIVAMVDRFEQSVGRWQQLPSINFPRSAGMAGVLGGKIYVAGGFDGFDGVSVCESFDPAVGIWEVLASMLTWHVGAAGAVADGKFYIVGGKTGTDAQVAEVFNPETGEWTSLPPMPDRHVYCAGGAALGSY